MHNTAVNFHGSGGRGQLEDNVNKLCINVPVQRHSTKKVPKAQGSTALAEEVEEG